MPYNLEKVQHDLVMASSLIPSYQEDENNKRSVRKLQVNAHVPGGET
jgi:hypothetical protein